MASANASERIILQFLAVLIVVPFLRFRFLAMVTAHPAALRIINIIATKHSALALRATDLSYFSLSLSLSLFVVLSLPLRRELQEKRAISRKEGNCINSGRSNELHR